jgi:predicted RND superfamily exporter protein
MLSIVRSVVNWCSRRRLVVWAASGAVLLVSMVGMLRLRFDSDLLALLPRGGAAVPAFRAFLDTFGSLDQLYIVFTARGDESIEDYDEEIDRWTRALLESPDISSVDTGVAENSSDLSWLADHQLLLLSDDALHTALARLQGRGMEQVLAQRRGLLALASSDISQLVRQDPLGWLDLLRDELGGSRATFGMRVGGRGYLSKDGRRRLLIAQPRRPPFDNEFAQQLFSDLATIDNRLTRQAHSDEPDADQRPPMLVEFAGGHRIAVETAAMVRRESIWNTVSALALILPVLFVVFRSAWLVGVGALPSAISLAVVLGVFGLAGMTLSVATAASAAMLFGLGIDGVVLLYVAYNHALHRGFDPPSAINALASPCYSMLLGMWTTAATFYGLVFVDFPTLNQLGLVIGHSMVLCGIFTLILVPATLRRRTGTARMRTLHLPWLSKLVYERSRAIVTAAVIVTVIAGAAAMRLRINTTLDRLKSETPGAIYQEQLVEMFGLPGDAYVVIQEGPELEALLTANESLSRRIADSTRVEVQAASTLLPSLVTQQRRVSLIRETGIAPAAVDAELQRYAAAAGFRPDALEPFRERLPRLLSASPLTYDSYREHRLGAILERFVARTPTGWRLASYVFPSNSAEVASVQAAVDATARGAVLTGIALVNRELAAAFVPQFSRGLVIGSVLVLVIVGWAFRDWWLSLLALLPTAVGLVWTAGLLALIGIELDLFALFAVVTFVGIGVDYGIHLVQRYRETADVSRSIAELAPVILVAAAITVFGYGTLVTSSYPPLRSIGVVSAVSVSMLTIASLVLLPALIWFGSNRSSASDNG